MPQQKVVWKLITTFSMERNNASLPDDIV